MKQYLNKIKIRSGEKIGYTLNTDMRYLKLGLLPIIHMSLKHYTMYVIIDI